MVYRGLVLILLYCHLNLSFYDLMYKVFYLLRYFNYLPKIIQPSNLHQNLRETYYLLHCLIILPQNQLALFLHNLYYINEEMVIYSKNIFHLIMDYEIPNHQFIIFHSIFFIIIILMFNYSSLYSLILKSCIFFIISQYMLLQDILDHYLLTFVKYQYYHQLPLQEHFNSIISLQEYLFHLYLYQLNIQLLYEQYYQLFFTLYSI